MGKTNYYTSRFKPKTFPITVVADHVTSDRNIGSLFRICDAFGVDELILCGVSPGLGRKAKQTSRSAEKYVHHSWYDDSLQVVRGLKQQGFYILCLEITENSRPLQSYQIPECDRLALVVGDERYGIKDEIINLADDIIHIEMFGHNSSMNVAQATNAALYELTRQLL